MSNEKIVKISVNCKALEDIDNHFFMMGDRWKETVLATLRKKFGKSIKMLDSKELGNGSKEYTLAIGDAFQIKIPTEARDRARALLEAMICYVSLHCGIKRTLCAECEHSGTENCLENYLSPEMVEKEVFI